MAAARANARRILHSVPEDTWAQVAAAIDYEQHGTAARIGIRAEGSLSEYLGEKEAREAIIVRQALQDVFGRGN